jgi:hypothetical protein
MRNIGRNAVVARMKAPAGTSAMVIAVCVAGLFAVACGGTHIHASGADAAAGSNGAAGAAGTGAAGAGTAGTGAGAAGAAAGGTGAGAADAGAAGSADADATGAAGTPGAAGTCAAGGAGAGATTGAAGSAGATGAAVGPVAGCGKDAPSALVPGTLVKQTIMTMGVKDCMCADKRCGAWTDTREYWVQLPTGYDKSKAYPLFLEGPGCGGHGNNLFSVVSFNNTVIRVGLTPSAYWQQYHATNPLQGCFDDHEGDDSVDFVFYETLWDQLASTLCFDRNRVFAGGNSSGGTLADELGCKYAGDAKRPIRGVLANSSAGLPTDARYVPTCTKSPMAGFWSHEIGDAVNPFAGTIAAMDRALTVNGCAPAGVTYTTAMFDNFPIGGGNADTACRKYRGCPDAAPLVVCPIQGASQGMHDNIVNPGWPAFLALFPPSP